ncbi:mRNA export factor GLE1-like [Montipora capricornis]|uniref:mRNA export factor GLE1-like n=1 Tax=Montipora capricornis TaxID=246305 RepID=UPI0035F1A35D
MEWKPECDLLLLQEITVSEPHQYKVSTRERGKIWEDITERLNANEAFAHRLGQKRAVRDRYALLSRKYKKKMTTEERASGISPEMSEIDKLLEQIIERFEESDRESGDKGEQGERSKTEDRKKAEEMRKLSMEKLGETLKRKGEEDEGVQNWTTRKRASGSETIVYLREKAARDFDLKKEEMETRKRDQAQQLQMFQYMQQQLQQQQQTQLLMTLIEKLSKN